MFFEPHRDPTHIACAIYSFQSQKRDIPVQTLTLDIGDLLHVYSSSNDWCFGLRVSDNKYGIFPANYVYQWECRVINSCFGSKVVLRHDERYVCDEAARALRQWMVLLKVNYFTQRRSMSKSGTVLQPFDYLVKQISKVRHGRRSLYNDRWILVEDDALEAASQLAKRLDICNLWIGLPLMPRTFSELEPIDVRNMSSVDLYMTYDRMKFEADECVAQGKFMSSRVGLRSGVAGSFSGSASMYQRQTSECSAASPRYSKDHQMVNGVEVRRTMSAEISLFAFCVQVANIDLPVSDTFQLHLELVKSSSQQIDNHLPEICSERFVINLAKDRDTQASKTHKILFTDLSESDLVSRFYLVVRIYKISTLLPDQKPKKNRILSYFRKPFGITVYPFKPSELAEGDFERSAAGIRSSGSTIKLDINKCANDQEFSNFYESSLASNQKYFLLNTTQSTSSLHTSTGTISSSHGHGQPTSSSLTLALKMIDRATASSALNAATSTTQSANEDYLDNLDTGTDSLAHSPQQQQHHRKHSLDVVRMLAFPDVVMPGDSRNDVYVLLRRGEFEKGSKAAQKNVEVEVVLVGRSGKEVKDGVASHTSGTKEGRYTSPVIYHCNTPVWNEIIRLSVSPANMNHYHVKFMLYHCSTKDKTDRKLFGFSFLPLMQLNSDGDSVLLDNGPYSLSVYKCDFNQKYQLNTPESYVRLPWRSDNSSATISTGGGVHQNDFGVAHGGGGKVLGAYFDRLHKDSVLVNLTYTTTSLAQNEKLLKFLLWRTKPVERIPKLVANLCSMRAPEETRAIMKILSDVLDNLFAILSKHPSFQDSAVGGKVPSSSQCAEAVLQALAYICSLAQDQAEYSSFLPVIETYINESFSATQAYREILNYSRQMARNVDTLGDIDTLREWFSVLGLIFRFVCQSRYLDISFRAGVVDTDFEVLVFDVFSQFSELLANTAGCHDIKKLLYKSIAPMVGELKRLISLDDLSTVLYELLKPRIEMNQLRRLSSDQISRISRTSFSIASSSCAIPANADATNLLAPHKIDCIREIVDAPEFLSQDFQSIELVELLVCHMSDLYPFFPHKCAPIISTLISAVHNNCIQLTSTIPLDKDKEELFSEWREKLTSEDGGDLEVKKLQPDVEDLLDVCSSNVNTVIALFNTIMGGIIERIIDDHRGGGGFKRRNSLQSHEKSTSAGRGGVSGNSSVKDDDFGGRKKKDDKKRGRGGGRVVDVKALLSSSFISLLHIAEARHFHSLLNSPNTVESAEQFLLRCMRVCHFLMVTGQGDDLYSWCTDRPVAGSARSPFNRTFLILHLEQSAVILKFFTGFITESLLEPRFSGSPLDFKDLWIAYFTLAINFILQPILQVEPRTNSKHPTAFIIDGLSRDIISKYDDMRVTMGSTLLAQWRQLTLHHHLFIPHLIESLIEVTMVPGENVRSVLMPIYSDLFSCQRFPKDLLAVKQRLAAAFDRLFNARCGDERFCEMFLEEVSRAKNCTLAGDLIKCRGDFDDQLSLLLFSRNLPEFDITYNYDVHALCAFFLMDFYKNKIRLADLYLHHLCHLARFHITTKSYTEVGLVIHQFAEALMWNDPNRKPVPTVIDGLKLPDPEGNPDKFDEKALQTLNLASKAELYHVVLHYYELGMCWEYGVKVCKELARYYETELYDYTKLSAILQKESSFFEQIVQPKKDDLRLEIPYYRVAFYGSSLPGIIQNKQFIYRGKPCGSLRDLQDRIIAQFPGTIVIPNTANPFDPAFKNEPKYIQITKVNPLPSKSPVFNNIVDVYIRKFFEYNDVSCFYYDMIDYKGVKPNSEPLLLFSSVHYNRTMYFTKHQFPGVLCSMEVDETRTAISTLKPIEVANHELSKMINEYRTLLNMSKRNSDCKQSDFQELQRNLQGGLKASVNGGPVIYLDAFLSPEVVTSGDERRPSSPRLRETTLLFTKTEKAASSLELERELLRTNLASLLGYLRDLLKLHQYFHSNISSHNTATNRELHDILQKGYDDFKAKLDRVCPPGHSATEITPDHNRVIQHTISLKNRVPAASRANSSSRSASFYISNISNNSSFSRNLSQMPPSHVVCNGGQWPIDSINEKEEDGFTDEVSEDGTLREDDLFIPAAERYPYEPPPSQMSIAPSFEQHFNINNLVSSSAAPAITSLHGHHLATTIESSSLSSSNRSSSDLNPDAPSTDRPHPS